MNMPKMSALFIFAIIPLAGFSLAAQMNIDGNTLRIPTSPEVIMPGDQGEGALSILPADRNSMKPEYRKIIFGWGEDKGTPANPDAMNQSNQGESGADFDKGWTGSNTFGNNSGESSPKATNPAPNQGNFGSSPSDRDQSLDQSGKQMDQDSSRKQDGSLQFVKNSESNDSATFLPVLKRLDSSDQGMSFGPGLPDSGNSYDPENSAPDKDSSKGIDSGLMNQQQGYIM